MDDKEPDLRYTHSTSETEYQPIIIKERTNTKPLEIEYPTTSNPTQFKLKIPDTPYLI